MSKVICDVCGTSYSETSTQCPICGCVRQGDPVTVNHNAQDSGAYTHMKGGRFSKSNVKKRNQGSSGKSKTNYKKSGSKKSTGLLIVLIILLLIISALVSVILLTLNSNQEQSPTQPTVIACTDIKLTQEEISMDTAGSIWMIYPQCTPTNTTDIIQYTSSNPEVVTVSANGKLTCVGEGSAEITVQCGNQMTTLSVSCVFPTEEQHPTVSQTVMLINRTNIFADFEGYSWDIYNKQDIPKDQIRWESKDPNIVTVNNGVITVHKEGSTEVYAYYVKDESVFNVCKIEAVFEEPTIGEGNGESPDYLSGDLTLYSQYGELYYNENIKAYDLTISIGESVGLFLKDSNGNIADVKWKITEGDSCSVDEAFVTAHSSVSNCMVEGEYNGKIYKCYIRTVN